MDWCIVWESSVNHKYMTIGGNSNKQYFVYMDHVSTIQLCSEKSDWVLLLQLI